MSEKKNLTFTAVLLSSKTDLRHEPRNAYPAIMLSIYCRTHMNGGTIEDIDKIFSDPIERAEIGLTAKQAKRILAAKSRLWRVIDMPDGRRDLQVLFYSVSHEQAARNMATGGRAGGLKSAAKRKQEPGKAPRPKSRKNDELPNFGAPFGFSSDSNDANIITPQSVDKENEKEKDSIPEKVSPLASGAGSKEKDIFPSEKYIKSGCSPKGTHPALDDSISDDDSAPLSREETAAFFEAIRRDIAADTEQASNQSETDGAEAGNAPKTANALEYP